MNRIALVVLGSLWLTSSVAAKAPVPVPAPTSCIERSTVFLGRVKAMIEQNQGFELRIYTGDRAVKLLAAFNADPPPTDVKADQIMVLSDSDSESKTVIVMFWQRGCMLKPLTAPRDHWHEVVRGALGDDA